jgi:hypothetical protein
VDRHVPQRLLHCPVQAKGDVVSDVRHRSTRFEPHLKGMLAGDRVTV